MRPKAATSLFLALCLGVSASAQYGAITPNLRRALVYSYNPYASADSGNTRAWCAYLVKLGAAHGIDIDTASDPSAFNRENLSRYQAVILFNAYLIGQGMSTAQKEALHDWYAANGGIACYHQCMKNAWGGEYPNWYDSLMGAHYKIAAGFATGPVYLDSEAVGTEFALNADSTPVPPGTSMRWSDEWATFDESPIGKAHTVLVWSARKSDFGFPFALPGERQPLAWARATNGGRFFLNSMYHGSDPMNTTDAALKGFNDGAFLNAMRWVAGYTGCMDPAYVEYNPKATHAGADACQHRVASSIRFQGASGSIPLRADQVRIAFSGPGPHSAGIYDSRGKRVAFVQGSGAAEYCFKMLPPGVYQLSARSGREAFSRVLLLL